MYRMIEVESKFKKKCGQVGKALQFEVGLCNVCVKI